MEEKFVLNINWNCWHVNQEFLLIANESRVNLLYVLINNANMYNIMVGDYLSCLPDKSNTLLGHTK